MVPGLKLLDKLDHPVAGQFITRQKIRDRKSLTKYRDTGCPKKMSVGDFVVIE